MSRFTIKQRLAQLDKYLDEQKDTDITFICTEGDLIRIESNKNGLLYQGPKSEGAEITNSLTGIVVRIPMFWP